jgi:hypothetical protein
MERTCEEEYERHHVQHYTNDAVIKQAKTE